MAAGKDGKAVEGQENGYHTVDNWMPCPQLPGTIVVNIGTATAGRSPDMFDTPILQCLCPSCDMSMQSIIAIESVPVLHGWLTCRHSTQAHKIVSSQCICKLLYRSGRH